MTHPTPHPPRMVTYGGRQCWNYCGACRLPHPMSTLWGSYVVYWRVSVAYWGVGTPTDGPYNLKISHVSPRVLRKINLIILFFYYLELDFRLTIVLQLSRRFNRCSLTHLLRSPNTCTYVRDLPHCSIAPVVILQRNCYQLNTKLQMNCSMP